LLSNRSRKGILPPHFVWFYKHIMLQIAYDTENPGDYGILVEELMLKLEFRENISCLL